MALKGAVESGWLNTNNVLRFLLFLWQISPFLALWIMNCSSPYFQVVLCMVGWTPPTVAYSLLSALVSQIEPLKAIASHLTPVVATESFSTNCQMSLLDKMCPRENQYFRHHFYCLCLSTALFKPLKRPKYAQNTLLQGERRKIQRTMNQHNCYVFI